MSSLTEQTPNALLKAMASGLPAVCTNACDTAYLLGDEQAPYIVAARDPAVYGASLRQLGEDEALRKRLGKLNRARCIDHFPMERMLTEYIDAYEEVLGFA